jgi:hypothetical protein
MKRLFVLILILSACLSACTLEVPLRMGAREIGEMQLVAYNAQGSEVWRESLHNALANEGQYLFLDTLLRGAAQPTNFYLPAAQLYRPGRPPRLHRRGPVPQLHRPGGGGMISKPAYNEEFRLRDMTPQLAAGETITAVVVTCAARAGGADQSAAMIANAAPYNQTSVRYLLKAGQPGQAYFVLVRVVTSAGQKLEDKLELNVV